MSVEQIINEFTNKETGEFAWGINTAMASLRPKCLYLLEASGGNFVISSWGPNWSDETQSYIQPPTSQEIRDEYIRHKTISECLEYFNKR
jgi:hypothetical protein